MTAPTTHANHEIHRARRPAGLWLVLALVAGFSVWALNGGVLFYYDSPGYVAQGAKMLVQLGLTPDQAGPGGAAALGESGDNLVNGSRSAVYALVAALLVRLGGINAIVLGNAAVTLLAVWLAVRVLARETAPGRSVAGLIGLPLLVAMAGSLSFYLAFVMPDILTPVLILVIATLAVFARAMTVFELFLAVSLGSFAVVSHISHIPIAAALLPPVAIAALIGGRSRWWLAPVLVAVMVFAGLAERQAFKTAVETVADAEVVYYPFLTARLIQDGPGWKYLNAKCPDPARRENIATCALFDALSRSDDPYRLTASHIIFKKTADLGSFQLMPPEEQARVARAQYRFYVDVFLWAPVSTGLSVIKNTLLQAVMNNVSMTIPDAEIVANTAESFPSVAADFTGGRLSANTGWLALVVPVQHALYGASLLAVGWLSLAGGARKLPAGARGFAAMVVLGILANAFVTGALSQPADRYGARVIWLLPFLAALLWQLRPTAATPAAPAATPAGSPAP